MLASLSIILTNPILAVGLLLCVVLGGTAFFTALHLCGINGLIATSMKYLLAIVSIEAITNSFMIVLNPLEFLRTYQCMHSLTIVMGFIGFWILIYEANWIIKHPKVNGWFKRSNTKVS